MAAENDSGLVILLLNDRVKPDVFLLENLHELIIPGLLLLESSEKALSITLSRVSWSREIHGTISAPCKLESCRLDVELLSFDV